MQRLPVVTGFGGFNPAGRSSAHHGYRRLVLDVLDTSERQATLLSLASLMGLASFRNGAWYRGEEQVSAAALVDQLEPALMRGSLIRPMEERFFDPSQVHCHQQASLSGTEAGPLAFEMAAKQLPNPVPLDWTVTDIGDGRVRVQAEQLSVMLDSAREINVYSFGQLPTGFEPDQHYNARFHPRGLQLAILGASDAINSMGIDWQTVASRVAPDQIAVYASSAMSQMDPMGNGGLLQSRLRGGRVSSKQTAMGLTSMPADFINAYVLGSVGTTGAVAGACATFLYNLRNAVEDIRAGNARVAVVGSAEAPLVPEIVDGFATMGALGNIDGLRKIFGEDVDLRCASRPFGENCGFTLSEGTQWVVLMDDALALELGANIYGAVPSVFVNADGTKKSISAPGAGNYLTVAKSVALARAILGEQAVREHSFMQAHGSSTPQNRITESAIFDRVAEAFGIREWPIVAVKAFLGHTVACASGDQMVTSLGIFERGVLPGVTTIDKVADDVHCNNLAINTHHTVRAPESLKVGFLNSKGFGGNNATATVFSPDVARQMLAARHGAKAMDAHQRANEAVQEKSSAYDAAATQGDLQAIYRFGEGMIDESEIRLDSESLTVPGMEQPVTLPRDNPFADMA